jgi:hypothetical protein
MIIIEIVSCLVLCAIYIVININKIDIFTKNDISVNNISVASTTNYSLDK